MANITDFAARFKGGVRANLFKVSLSGSPELFNSMEFLCKGASLPGQTVPAIDVGFRGRTLKVPGDRSFDDWEITILNDPEMINRSSIEAWMTRITASSANYSDFERDELGYYGQASVSQLDRQQNVIRTYRLHVLPTTVSAIELDMTTNDEVEDFTVTFAVNYMTIDGQGVDATAGGSGVDIQGGGQLTIGDVTVGIRI